MVKINEIPEVRARPRETPKIVAKAPMTTDPMERTPWSMLKTLIVRLVTRFLKVFVVFAVFTFFCSFLIAIF